MEIQFISPLTSEDEDSYAPCLLAALIPLLDRLACPYTLRIRTASNRTYEHSRPVKADPDTREHAGTVAGGHGITNAKKPSTV